MEATATPQLTDRTPKPRGVMNKNTKLLIYAGFVVLIIVAAIFGNHKPKPVAHQSADAAPPILNANTANNAETLKAAVASDRQAQADHAKQAGQPQTTPEAPNPYAMHSYSSSGQPLAAGQPGFAPQGQPTANTSTGSPSPEQQETEQLAQKERERQYQSRFESNLVFAAAPTKVDSAENTYTPQQGAPSNLTPAEFAEKPKEQGSAKRAAEVNVDAATGQPYVIYEGTTLDTVLMNRLDGDSAGPVKVLVSQPLYSHDHQHVLIPDGSVILGEARKLGGSGFGQQRRISLVFHRLLMPDGYSVDLDQFHGLDQIGEEALKDKVNNHYLQIFGTSIALGVISGTAQITQGGTGYNSNGSESFVNGASAGISQQATTVLDRFIQIPPTITIREGHRVKVWISQDMLLPAYENHTINQAF